MRAHLRRHPVAVFVAVTYAVTWAAWLSLAARHVTVGDSTSPLYMLGLFGPLVGAVVTTAIVSGRQGLRALGARMLRVRVGVRGWAAAIALPLSIAAVAYVVQVAYAMFLFAPTDLPTFATLGRFTGFPATNAITLAVLLVVINGYGEETGWRGFLLPTLERTLSPLGASLVVAVIWAGWHAPAFLINANYRDMPVVMLPLFFLGLACGSVFLTWLHNRAAGSIAVVAVWHGLFNLVSGSVGARGWLAPLETTAVMLIAAALVARELRTHHVLAPA